LPFLFKVLAAARPLSIQAHPDKNQAEAGFERENRDGIALDAPDRNYRDANHKPEIICALTPFWALNGFRPPAAAADLLMPVCPPELVDACSDLKTQPASFALQRLFEAMMALRGKKRKAATETVCRKAKRLAGRSAVYGWMDKLARVYPNDIGILSPALLNLIRLEPGQAMYLPAGQLHGYLDGVGIELMANSDNVLRGGLTPKHVDVAELLRVVRFDETRVDIIESESVDACESTFACPAEEFSLSVIRTTSDLKYRSSEGRNVEILLCTEGEGRIEETGGDTGLIVKKGDSFLVPASIAPYVIRGDLVLYKAAAPGSPQ
jgi:mannose-6-phosphate isomerase